MLHIPYYVLEYRYSNSMQTYNNDIPNLDIEFRCCPEWNFNLQSLLTVGVFVVGTYTV